MEQVVADRRAPRGNGPTERRSESAPSFRAGVNRPMMAPRSDWWLLLLDVILDETPFAVGGALGKDVPMSSSLRQDSDDLLQRMDHFDRQPQARALRARIRDLLRVEAGDTAVDVGCGAGTAVRELSTEGVRAIGVDVDPGMLQVARTRHPDGDFRQADAYLLPLADGQVRGYRAEKLFHAIAEPERALAEAHRVLAPGGRIVLTGQDWDAIAVASDDPVLARDIVHAAADVMTAPRAPRHQPELLRAAGFTGVEVGGELFVFTHGPVVSLLTQMAARAGRGGTIPVERAQRWVAEQRARAERGALYVAVPYAVVTADRQGTNPEGAASQG